MPHLFSLTLFVSAALLFVVQPMIAKLLLPLLGGSSSVWTTCMVFFQVMLLAGYLYAHLITRHASPWGQLTVQLGLLLAALATLPFQISDTSVQQLAAGSRPESWLLLQLLLVVGLPFLVVSTTGPLLQRWFSQIGHTSSGDPYFLYAASNLGSLLALGSYPLWLESAFELNTQARLWQWVFGGLIVLVAVCGWGFARTREGHAQTTSANAAAAPAGEYPAPEVVRTLSWSRRGFWVLLAFTPSSLLLGVTTYLTTDIASIPLLWVIPLSLYLLTFVFAFARRQWLPPSLIHRLLPILGVMLVFTIVCRATEPTWFLLLINLLFFFTAALACHGRLAADRPAPAQLTEFYLWLSIGGALGGIFNALVAPLVFREVLEYPLAILLACALYQVPAGRWKPAPKLMRSWWSVIALAALAILLAVSAKEIGLTPGLLTNVLIFGVPVVLCFGFVRQPLRFVTALASVLLAAHLYVELNKRTVFVDRSFFGVSRVTVSANGLFRQLDHGSTAHGRQFINPDRACEPLAYYHQAGPLGTIFTEFNRTNVAPNVGLIGLGAGATLAYAQREQTWDIYEIDPLVIQIAQSPELFSYLTACCAVAPRIIEGDGRLQLARAPAAHYGLLILDAFSSDAIPMHLLTAEAVELYFSKIADGGWLAMHLSNRYLDLEQVMAGLANVKGYVGLSWIDDQADRLEGKEQSQWLVLVRRETDLRGLTRDPNRIPLESRPAGEPWTDARSSLLPVFKW
jgi:spermidine synthase